jgi:SAM-dependent methyltransferase
MSYQNFCYIIEAMKYSSGDIDKNAGIYGSFLTADLDDGWSFKDKQENFEILAKIFEYTVTLPSQSSVLDAGCGTGDLAGFLETLQIKNYLGIDIFLPAVEKAARKYPDKKFKVGDFLMMPEQKFDFVVCSGALTTNLDSDNYLVLETWIKKMWRMARKGIVFNVLMERFPGDNTRSLFTYDRIRVLEITAKVSPKAKMKIETTDAGSGDGTQELHVFLMK